MDLYSGYLLTLLCGVFFLIHSFQMRTEKKEFFERALPVTEVKIYHDADESFGLGVLFSVCAIGIPLIFLISQIRRNIY